MRRKQGILLEIEWAIIDAGLSLQAQGEGEFHGYSLAKAMRDSTAARRLVAHGTLYKALDRLEASGLVQSRWEDPREAAQAGRPRRRLYQVTAEAARLLAQAARSVPAAANRFEVEPGRA